MKNITKQQKGFTIIEVLIVLAIAGLILLIVFLAVPALQRNSRNTQKKNDVASVVGYINEFASNNNGALPNDICTNGNTGDVHFATTGSCSASSPLAGKVRGGITVDDGTTAASDLNTIVIALGHRCNGTAVGDATARAIAATYQVETTGDVAQQCQES